MVTLVTAVLEGRGWGAALGGGRGPLGMDMAPPLLSDNLPVWLPALPFMPCVAKSGPLSGAVFSLGDVTFQGDMF